jgi:hypothetical protein
MVEKWQFNPVIKQCFLFKGFAKGGKIEKKWIRVLIHMVFAWTEGDVIGPSRYRLVIWERGKKRRFCLSALVTPPKERWPMPRLRPDPEPRWKRVESLDERQVIHWIRRRFGDRTTDVLASLGIDARNAVETAAASGSCTA